MRRNACSSPLARRTSTGRVTEIPRLTPKTSPSTLCFKTGAARSRTPWTRRSPIESTTMARPSRISKWSKTRKSSESPVLASRGLRRRTDSLSKAKCLRAIRTFCRTRRMRELPRSHRRRLSKSDRKTWRSRSGRSSKSSHSFSRAKALNLLVNPRSSADLIQRRATNSSSTRRTHGQPSIKKRHW